MKVYLSLSLSLSHTHTHTHTQLLQVIGADCGDNEMWTAAIREGAKALGDIPRIALFGTEDGMFSVDSCQEAARLLGIGHDGCYPLEGVGHLCMLEAHERVSDICMNFIAKL